MLSNYQLDKTIKVSNLKSKIQIAGKQVPEIIQLLINLGLVLMARDFYAKGFEPENEVYFYPDIEYRYDFSSDEKILKNYNKLYQIISIKWGHLM
jgi:hypothetical protein